MPYYVSIGGVDFQILYMRGHASFLKSFNHEMARNDTKQIQYTFSVA